MVGRQSGPAASTPESARSKAGRKVTGRTISRRIDVRRNRIGFGLERATQEAIAVTVTNYATSQTHVSGSTHHARICTIARCMTGYASLCRRQVIGGNFRGTGARKVRR